MNTPKEFLSGKPAYPGPQRATPGLLKDQLLDSLKNKSWTDSASLLKQLSEEIQSAHGQTSAPPLTTKALDALIEKSMIAWVDRFFDYFQDFAAELTGELKVHGIEIFCERPVICRIGTHNPISRPNGTSIVFRGCLNTGSWTLLLRGQQESIEAFIVPSDRYLSLTPGQDTFRRLLFLESEWQSQDVIWKHSSGPTTYDAIGGMARQLFSYLIQFAAGQRQESELWLKAEDNLPATSTSINQPQVSAQAAMTVSAAAQLLSNSIAEEIALSRDAGMAAVSRTNLAEAQRITSYISQLQNLQQGLTQLMTAWLASTNH